MTKLKEIKLFTSAGFPVPATTKLTPDMVLDESAWGPFVVLKPNTGRQGRGIRLVRTRDARWVDPMSWPQDDPRRGKDILAQQYVHAGQYSRSYRVFTVLGKVIYSMTSTATQPLPAPDPNGKDPVDINITANGVERILRLSDDREVIDLAQNIHRKLSEIPTMGIDILRQDGTGNLFVMEMNSRGFTWHLSSDYGLVHQRKYSLDYYGQFNALSTIADALIDTTRRLAA